MAKRSVQDLKAELQKMRSIIPWDEVKVGATYHIPPIITLERRDITIVTKDGDNATYKRVGDNLNELRKLHRTSVFSRFLVEKKKF